MSRITDKTSGFLPLERRSISIEDKNGRSCKVPAWSKDRVPDHDYLPFEIPDPSDLETDRNTLDDWIKLMELYKEDLKWLLQLSYHEFWSIVKFTNNVSQIVLLSFLQRAPRSFHPNYEAYRNNELFWPLFNEIYNLIFLIFLRLSTYKESKENFISPVEWSNMLYENEVFNIEMLMNFCSLYESRENILLPKMIENIIKLESRFLCILAEKVITSQLRTLEQIDNDLGERVERLHEEKNSDELQELLIFEIDFFFSLFKFIKVYPEVAFIYHQYRGFLVSFASSYEKNAFVWGKVCERFPKLRKLESLLRKYRLVSFKKILCGATINNITTSNDLKLDQFFEALSNCFEFKIFIHDYESAFPFMTDMQIMINRGIYIEETRLEYLFTAISDVFDSCGEEYSAKKIVTDPFYDPAFDRQLMGACSLDLTGFQLESLITQVKDLFPDLPNSYIEVCLKHFEYKADVVINNILENTVPTRFEKYKKEDYVRSSSETKLNPTSSTSSSSQMDSKDNGLRMETYYQGKRAHGSDPEAFFNEPQDTDLKSKIISTLEIVPEQTILRPEVISEEFVNKTYLDEALLPYFNEDVEYNDDYDDTYDEVGIGQTEPDNLLFNPLNKKAAELKPENGFADYEEPKPKNPEHFCEDPAIIRAKFEQRREEKHQQRRGGSGNAPQAQPERHHDVIGKAKGQGQEKDVLYNRRVKEANKGTSGNHNRKRGATHKRREF